MSRGPVREAFRILEEAGLVRLEKNRGVFVRSIPLDEAVEIYDLRAMVTRPPAARWPSASRPSSSRTLRSMVEQMERLVKDGHNTSASDPYHLLNLAFHDRMVEFVGNRKLIDLYRRLVKELSLFRRVNLADGQQIPVSVQEHRAILKAIAAGDADGAPAPCVPMCWRARSARSKHNDLRRQCPRPPAWPAPRPWLPAAAPAPIPIPVPVPAPRKARHA